MCRAHGGNVWGGLPALHVVCCLGAYLRLSVAVVLSSVRLVIARVRSPRPSPALLVFGVVAVVAVVVVLVLPVSLRRAHMRTRQISRSRRGRVSK